MKYTTTPNKKRLAFIPELVASDMKALMNFEAMVYGIADKSTQSDPKPYGGGYWEFRTYENGAKAMVLDEDRRFKVQCGTNWYDGNMSAEALSLACNMWACSNLSFAVTGKAQENLANNYHLLSEAVAGLEDEGEIFAFLD